MDQQSTYRAGASGKLGSSVANVANASHTTTGPWALHLVQNNLGNFTLRLNVTTGECYYADLSRNGLATGWRFIPNASDGVDAAEKAEKAEKAVTTGSI